MVSKEMMVGGFVLAGAGIAIYLQSRGKGIAIGGESTVAPQSAVETGVASVVQTAREPAPIHITEDRSIYYSNQVYSPQETNIIQYTAPNQDSYQQAGTSNGTSPTSMENVQMPDGSLSGEGTNKTLSNNSTTGDATTPSGYVEPEYEWKLIDSWSGGEVAAPAVQTTVDTSYVPQGQL